MVTQEDIKRARRFYKSFVAISWICVALIVIPGLQVLMMSPSERGEGGIGLALALILVAPILLITISFSITRRRLYQKLQRGFDEQSQSVSGPSAQNPTKQEPTVTTGKI